MSTDQLSSTSMNHIHTTYSGRLQRYLLRLTFGDRDLAEDLLQDTMLRVWRRIDQVPTGLDDLGPWLFTVARNIAIDRARARAVRPRETGAPDVAELPAVTDAFDSLVKAMTVRTALLNLPEKHRCVLVELYYRGATAAEAAARLGIPEGTVKSRAHYAMVAMRAALEGAEAA